jgi:hypothetical protein
VSTRRSALGKCRLCDTEGVELRNGHVIPQLIFRHIKRRDLVRTFGVGRLSQNPEITQPPERRPIQDGTKIPILCHRCEQRLSKWEDRFARDVLKACRPRK